MCYLGSTVLAINFIKPLYFLATYFIFKSAHDEQVSLFIRHFDDVFLSGIMTVFVLISQKLFIFFGIKYGPVL